MKRSQTIGVTHNKLFCFESFILTELNVILFRDAQIMVVDNNKQTDSLG